MILIKAVGGPRGGHLRQVNPSAEAVSEIASSKK